MSWLRRRPERGLDSPGNGGMSAGINIDDLLVPGEKEFTRPEAIQELLTKCINLGYLMAQTPEEYFDSSLFAMMDIVHLLQAELDITEQQASVMMESVSKNVGKYYMKNEKVTHKPTKENVKNVAKAMNDFNETKEMINYIQSMPISTEGTTIGTLSMMEDPFGQGSVNINLSRIGLLSVLLAIQVNAKKTISQFEFAKEEK